MSKQEIATGVVHDVPEDMREALHADPELLTIWNGLTLLARNEWICWVTIVKKEETRREHVVRWGEDLRKGKKRPCCWPGCPHRRESAKKWFQ